MVTVQGGGSAAFWPGGASCDPHLVPCSLSPPRSQGGPARPGPAAARPRHREEAGRGIHFFCSFADSLAVRASSSSSSSSPAAAGQGDLLGSVVTRQQTSDHPPSPNSPLQRHRQLRRARVLLERCSWNRGMVWVGCDLRARPAARSAVGHSGERTEHRCAGLDGAHRAPGTCSCPGRAVPSASSPVPCPLSPHRDLGCVTLAGGSSGPSPAPPSL